mmetsp:Transcript_28684/g.91554  ORF Transcript_28684/g.91554 Transcript_28684/m.91554 type:complete len:269 (+) Transcript_28684:838-1644(+)
MHPGCHSAARCVSPAPGTRQRPRDQPVAPPVTRTPSRHLELVERFPRWPRAAAKPSEPVPRLEVSSAIRSGHPTLAIPTALPDALLEQVEGEHDVVRLVRPADEAARDAATGRQVQQSLDRVGGPDIGPATDSAAGGTEVVLRVLFERAEDGGRGRAALGRGADGRVVRERRRHVEERRVRLRDVESPPGAQTVGRRLGGRVGGVVACRRTVVAGWRGEPRFLAARDRVGGGGAWRQRRSCGCDEGCTPSGSSRGGGRRGGGRDGGGR